MPTTINFTDTSTPGPSGPITAWAWNFGDGGTSTSENPSHSYTNPGTYPVTLVVTGSGSDGTSSSTQQVTVSNVSGLAASFTASISGLTVTFTDTSTPGGSGPITAWAWNFGDSNTSSSQNPSHTYAAGGTYTVTLTVTGTSPDGTANVSHQESVASGGSVVFNGRATQLTTLTSHEVSSTGGYNIGPVTWPDGSVHYFYTAESPSLYLAGQGGCLCFTHDDISLAADSRYTKTYSVAVTTGDTNQWHGSTGGTVNGGGQISKIRNSGIGTTDWYAIGIQIPSWNLAATDIFFCDLYSLGYQTSSNDQFALGLEANNSGQLSFYVAINGGQTGIRGGTVQGNAPGTSSYRDNLGVVVTIGQNEEFAVGIKWSTNTQTGFVQIYHRSVVGGVPGTWTKIYDRENIDTYLWGTITNHDGSLYKNFATDASNWPTVIDKFGLYFGHFSQTVTTEHSLQPMGVMRCSDLATAQAQFPG